MAAKSMFAFFFSLPPRTIFLFNNSETTHLGFAFILASKLYIAASESSISRQTLSLRRLLNMPSVLKQVISRIDSLMTSDVDADGDRDAFSRYKQRFLRLQSWFEKHFQSGPESQFEQGYENPQDAPQNVPQVAEQYHQGMQPTVTFPGNYADVPMTDQGFAHDNFYDIPLAENLGDINMDDFMIDWLSYPGLLPP